MYKRVSHTRAALLGLLFAMVGFSFALATSRGLDIGVESRAVGSSTLRFTNPLLSGDRDLGDAVLGSALVRYARATGGVRPYRFTSTVTTSPGTLATAISGTTATLSLALNGVISGSLGNITIAKNPLRFNISVTEAEGTNPNSVTEPFRLTLVDSTAPFRFAVSALSEAIQYQPYVDVLALINGNSPFTFTATGITINGTSATSLETAGLSLSNDGTVYGKPIVAGTVVFTAHATDAKGNKALNRAGTAEGQTITLTVTANSIIVSDFITTSMSIKTGVAGKDSIKYAGTANMRGAAPSSLANKVLTLRVGGYTTPNTTATPAVFDSKGKIAKPATKSKTAPTLTGSVSTKSQLKISVGKETFGTAFGTISGGTKVLAVQITIGDVLVGSETLEFTVKTGSKGSTLTYKFSSDSNLGGTFLLTSVQGKDDTKSAAEDSSWKVAFVATPPSTVGPGSSGFAAGSFTGATSAVVTIGSTFSDTITVAESKGKVKSTEKSDPKSANVTKLAMDAAKGKGSAQTGFIPTTSTGIRQGSAAGGVSSFFPFGVVLRSSTAAVFTGEASIVIYPGTKNGWKSQLPK